MLYPTTIPGTRPTRTSRPTTNPLRMAALTACRCRHPPALVLSALCQHPCAVRPHRRLPARATMDAAIIWRTTRRRPRYRADSPPISGCRRVRAGRESQPRSSVAGGNARPAEIAAEGVEFAQPGVQIVYVAGGVGRGIAPGDAWIATTVGGASAATRCPASAAIRACVAISSSGRRRIGVRGA